MTPHTLWPCSVTFNLTTGFSRHKMTLPLTAWSPVSTGHPAGTNLAWDDSQADTDDMVVGLVDLLRPFWPSTATFTNYTIYTYDSVNAPARPRISIPIVSGAGTGGATIPAAQATFNFKSAGFFPFKLVMLDARVSSTFAPLETLVSPANDDEIAIVNWLTADTNAFSARDNTQITTFERVTYTLNEKLRKSYRLD